MKRAEEMTPLLETVESQHQASHSFPQALGNLANTARFPHSLSSCDYDCAWKLITLTTGASRTRGLLSYLTQPTPVWVTSLNDLTGTGHLHQTVAVAEQRSQRAHLLRRAKRSLQQTHRMQILQPLAIAYVRLPARHVLHVMSINQTHLETVLFQDLKQRDPENSGRFHRNRFHAAFSEPLRNFVQIFRECLIAPHRLWIPVPRHRNIYTRCSDVDARGIVLLHPLGMLRLCLRLALSCHAPSPLSESSGAARVVQETSTLLNGIAAQRHHCLAHRTWSHAVKRVQRTPCDSRLLACLPDDSHQCRKSRPPRFWISSVPYLIARRTAQARCC